MECSSPSNGNVIELDFSDGPMNVQAKPDSSTDLTFVWRDAKNISFLDKTFDYRG